MRTIVATLVAFVVLTLSQSGSAAQTGPDAFPTRPVKLVVPFPAVGPTDLMARLFGQKLSDRWAQPVVVENRPGGNSAIGAQQVAKSAPDGYTLLVAMDATLVMNPITSANLPYDAQRFRADLTHSAEHLALDRARRRSAIGDGVDRQGQG
jgi:tripartite-type tricarboxylate transporter receptor subunit TctC